MAKERQRHSSAADLLSDWRAAGRDTVAARAAARVAGLALKAATAAEAAATEVEAAARAALEAVEKARDLAATARAASMEAEELAASILEEAGGGKVRANHDVEVAEQAEQEAGEAFHRAEAEGFPKD